MQIDATEQPTPRSPEWLDGWNAGRAQVGRLASAVTTARSQVDTAQTWLDLERDITAEMHREIEQAQKGREKAEAARDEYLLQVARVEMQLQAAQAALGDLMHEHADAMAALQEAFDESGWAESYVLKDGTLHPGATSTVAAVFKALYPEGKAK